MITVSRVLKSTHGRMTSLLDHRSPDLALGQLTRHRDVSFRFRSCARSTCSTSAATSENAAPHCGHVSHPPPPFLRTLSPAACSTSACAMSAARFENERPHCAHTSRGFLVVDPERARFVGRGALAPLAFANDQGLAFFLNAPEEAKVPTPPLRSIERFPQECASACLCLRHTFTRHRLHSNAFTAESFSLHPRTGHRFFSGFRDGSHASRAWRSYVTCMLSPSTCFTLRPHNGHTTHVISCLFRLLVR